MSDTDAARRLIYGDDPTGWPSADAEDPQPAPATIRPDWVERIQLRMLGDNITLSRTQWLELLDALEPSSDLARRIRSRLTTAHAETIREESGCAWEYACIAAERYAAA